MKAPNRRRYHRPDTYDDAADSAGLSLTHTFGVLHGTRQTTPAKARKLLAWAKANAKRGRADAPAVVAALANLDTAA